MYNDVKERNIASWDIEAWIKALNKITNDEEDMSSNVERISESKGVGRVGESKNNDENKEQIFFRMRGFICNGFFKF